LGEFSKPVLDGDAACFPGLEFSGSVATCLAPNGPNGEAFCLKVVGDPWPIFGEDTNGNTTCFPGVGLVIFGGGAPFCLGRESKSFLNGDGPCFPTLGEFSKPVLDGDTACFPGLEFSGSVATCLASN